jgi:dCTP deaminase
MIRAIADNIKGYNEDNIQPASLDITLGDSLLIEKSENKVINAAEDSPDYIKVGVEDRPIRPLGFVLGHTRESIEVPADITVMLAGKSTLARLGLSVHITAGWVDPGYKGQLTLEIFNHSNNYIQLEKGMKIGQLVFMEMKNTPDSLYNGKYQNSEGAIGSRVKREPVVEIKEKEEEKLKVNLNPDDVERDLGESCETGICPPR